MGGEQGRPPRPDRFDVVVFGDYHRDWLDIIGPGKPFWDGMEGVASVSHRSGAWRGDAGEDGTRQLVIPLLENEIESITHPCWSLKPSRKALRTLADKQLFAEHVSSIGLDDYLPRHFATPAEASFPALVKIRKGYGGKGIALVNSVEEIAATLARPPWSLRRSVIQEYVDRPIDYSVHALCAGGRIVWHQAYTFGVNPADPIRHPRLTDVPAMVHTRAYDLAIMEQIVRPIRFSGPANFNYRIRQNGNAAFFEINPRLGGSLFRQAGHADLRTMMSLIIKKASWHPAAGP